MATCIVCGKEVHIDDGYATDGKIFVCRYCAETETLRTITVYINNAGVESALVYKREAPIELAVESGLVNQTDEKPHVELDKSVLDEAMSIADADNAIFSDIENMSEEDFVSKYATNPQALNAWMDAHSVESGESDFPLPNGCSETCEHYPYDTCPYYYGELHQCMEGEE